MFLASTARLRAVMRRESEGGAPIAAGARAATPVPADGPGAAGRARRSRGSPHASREVGDQPVLWREVRQRVFRRPVLMRIAVWAVVLIALFVYYQVMLDRTPGSWGLDPDRLSEEGLNFPVAAIGTGIAILLACFGSGTLIAGERESRTWEVLLATPLSAREIVMGKFLGALRRQVFIPAVVVGHFLFVGLLGPVRLSTALYTAVLISGGVAAVTATGLLASMWVSKSVRAAALNFAFWLGVWAGLPMAVGIICASFGLDADTPLSLVCTINPVGMAVVACTGGVRPERFDAYEWYGFDRLSEPVFVILLVVLAALSAGFTLGVLRLAAGVLAARTARSR
jgi:ABC-type transport system involved in multi-copper enzyme maturation permease subunit